jgi:hypothetical protein
MHDEKPLTIRDLYPDFSPDQLEEAAANLRRYLAALLRMAERLEAEGKSINDLAVDGSFDDREEPLYHPTANG